MSNDAQRPEVARQPGTLNERAATESSAKRRRAPEPSMSAFESLGWFILVMLVAALLLLLAMLLYMGVVYFPIEPSYIATHPYDRFPERVGIEFVVFPFGALAAALLRQRLAGIAALRDRRIGEILPFLAAVALVAWLAFLGWTWREDGVVWIGLERVLGVALTASIGFFGAILYPRLTATMAGAIAGPTLVGLVALTFSWDLLYRLDTERSALWPTVALAGLIAGLALLAVSVLITWLRLWPRTMIYAGVSGSIMLGLAIVGLVSFFSFRHT